MRLREYHPVKGSVERAWLKSQGYPLSSALRIGNTSSKDKQQAHIQQQADLLTSSLEGSLQRLKKLASQATPNNYCMWKLLFQFLK